MEGRVDDGVGSEADAFQCVVCLDILYKPVVLACGHTYCFWCSHKAMSGILESSCAVCRQPYNYFPSICQLLHLLLQKMDPIDYKRREVEIFEEEKRIGKFSPQFLQCMPESSNSNASNAASAASCSLTRCDDICVSDVLCASCNQLIFLPAVLNCGHVYCGSCMADMPSETIKCLVCHSRHPGEPPKCCLVLDHFLKQHFSQEYARRRELFKLQNEPHNGSRTPMNMRNGNPFIEIDNGFICLKEDVPNIHLGIGCDSCGMCPIIGKRYKCKDCKEAIGFDLCEECYSSSSNLPGRFNQQHTPDHVLVADDSQLLINLWKQALHDVDSGNVDAE